MILTSRAILRHHIFRIGLVFALLVFTDTTDPIILSRAQSEHSSTPLLAKSTTITKQILKEFPHLFEIEMKANEYAAIVLRKGDLKLVARVFGPEEKLLGEFVSVRYEPLYVCFLSKQQGKHRLEIRSLEQNNSSSPYDLEVETHGPPTGDDLKVVEARKLMMEAGRLRAEWREPSIKEAIVNYSSALKVWQEISRPDETAKTLEELGDTHFLLSEYRQAQENYLQASRTVRASDRQSRIETLTKASYVDIYLGQSRRALESASGALRYYARLRSRATDVHEQRHEAEAENTAGEASYSLGRLRQSIEFFNRALALWKLSNDRGGQALANLNLGYAYSERGDLSKAQEYFATALALWRETGDQRGKALTLTAQGTIHSFLGEKQTALDNHLQAMKLFGTIGDRAGEAVTRNSIGYLYEELNEPHIAMDNYERALEIYQQIGNRDFEAVTRYYLGGVKKTLGDKEEALKYFKESLALSRLVGQRRLTAYALSSISALRSTEGSNDEALRWLNQALAVYRSVGDGRGQAIALNEIGRIYHSLGQTKRALAYYRRALPVTRAAGDLNSESVTLYQMALAARDSGSLDDALQYIRDAIEAIESLRAQIVSPELRASYFASVNKYSELHINLLMKLDKLQPEKRLAQSAFEASENARALGIAGDHQRGQRRDPRGRRSRLIGTRTITTRETQCKSSLPDAS
jgi:tetratricopeptide (TPR) repeat protein